MFLFITQCTYWWLAAGRVLGDHSDLVAQDGAPHRWCGAGVRFAAGRALVLVVFLLVTQKHFTGGLLQGACSTIMLIFLRSAPHGFVQDVCLVAERMRFEINAIQMLIILLLVA